MCFSAILGLFLPLLDPKIAFWFLINFFGPLSPGLVKDQTFYIFLLLCPQFGFFMKRKK